MRFLLCASIFFVLTGVVACSSYEEKRKTETAIEKAVDKFHERLNHEQYHHIYADADSALHSRISEPEFTSQIRNAHQQLGTTHDKAIVIINDSMWRGLRKTFGADREIVSHMNMPAGDLI